MAERTPVIDDRATVDMDHALGLLASCLLPACAESVHVAREFVGLIFDSWNLPNTENAQLCVSELASNVIRHCHESTVNLRIEMKRFEDQVRVEVYDRSTEEPKVPDSLPDYAEDANGEIIVDDIGESGNGLFLVRALSSDFGCEPPHGDGGKAVWFAMSVD
jgi:anti-sigma regulatory factor (Ser/Thr protein kinase)